MVTPMNVADTTEFDNILQDMESLVDLQKVILVFDRGYWKVERFINLTLDGTKFITRLKKVYTGANKKGWKKEKMGGYEHRIHIQLWYGFQTRCNPRWGRGIAICNE